jgi:hypothetical protein
MADKAQATGRNSVTAKGRLPTPRGGTINRRVNVRLSLGECERLTVAAAARGVTPAELLRQCFVSMLVAPQDRARLLAEVAGKLPRRTRATIP